MLAYGSAPPGTRIAAGTALALNPYAVSGSTVQAHGLAGAPKYLRAELECLTAEHNYSIGDKILLGPWQANSAGQGSLLVLVDATNVTLIRHSTTPCIINKTTFGFAALTAANWKLTITPFYWV